MTDEAKPKGRKKPVKPEDAESTLATAAKAIGAAAGKVAVMAGIAEPAPTPPPAKSQKKPKLQSKNKSRLPRRQKKAMQKKAAAQA